MTNKKRLRVKTRDRFALAAFGALSHLKRLSPLCRVPGLELGIRKATEDFVASRQKCGKSVWGLEKCGCGLELWASLRGMEP